MKLTEFTSVMHDINVEITDFINEKIRQEKQKELIDKGYALSFDWQDIETIGVKGIRKWLRTICMCKKQFHISFENAISKVKLISFI